LESDKVKAASVGFGVFMGIFPIWGFQMLVALFVSIYLRLNKTLVILAANISILPMMPLILYLSHYTGKIWMGRKAQSITFSDDITLDLVHTHFVQYVYGAITLALISGLVFGVVTYGILKLSKRKRNNFQG
jgi:uncharacterized protein (DUF2062 family)